MNDLNDINEPKAVPAIWADTRAAGFDMASELAAAHVGGVKALGKIS